MIDPFRYWMTLFRAAWRGWHTPPADNHESGAVEGPPAENVVQFHRETGQAPCDRSREL